MRHLGVFLSCMASASAFAQWSADPFANLNIADRTGEQVQPKIRATADGSTYVSWYDNSTGGYDVYLQRLDAAGVEQWAHNGVLVADRSFSSTVDYDLEVDASGNAILAFNDNRSGTDHITVAKYTADGTLAWSVQTTTGSVFRANPKVSIATDGAVLVGWTENGACALQRLAAATGAPQWIAPVTVSESGRSYTLADIAPTTAGGVLISYIRPTTSSFLSPKHIYSRAFDASGAQTWAAPTIVFDGGSTQNGYFPPIIPDGQGGAIFAWYNTGGSRQVLVQRINASGVERWAHNGVALAVDASVIQTDNGVAYDADRDVIFASFVVANATQSQWGWRAQAISASGDRLWSDLGVELLPLSTTQKSIARAVADGNGLTAACFDARSALTGVLVAAGLSPAGQNKWEAMPIELCSNQTGKSNKLEAAHNGVSSVFVWSDGAMGSGDILVQNVSDTGQLGPALCVPDFNGDGFLDFFDYDDYVVCFETGACPAGRTADINNDDFIDFFDYDDFVTAFEVGC